MDISLHVPQHNHGGHRTTLLSWLVLSFHLDVHLRDELRLAGCVASACAHWGISMAQEIQFQCYLEPFSFLGPNHGQPLLRSNVIAQISMCSIIIESELLCTPPPPLFFILNIQVSFLGLLTVQCQLGAFSPSVSLCLHESQLFVAPPVLPVLGNK